MTSWVNALGGGNCVVIANLTGSGSVDLDCGGYGPVDLNATHTGKLFDIHDNAPGINVNLTHCWAVLNPALYWTQNVDIYNSNLNWNYGGLNNVVLHFSGDGIGAGTGSFSFTNATGNNGQVIAVKCSYPNIQNNTLSGYSSSNNIAAAIMTTQCQNPTIKGNTITGTGVTNNEGLDDGIVIQGDGTDLDTPITSGNTISYVYDCGIEIVGKVSYWLAQYNDVSHYGVCGLGGWYAPSYVYHGTFDANNFHHSTTGTPFKFYNPYLTTYSSAGVYYLDISNTTYDNSNPYGGVQIGVNANTFGHLNLTNNNFGSQAVLYGGSGFGLTDGGGNYCGWASDSQLTCH